MFSVSVQSTAYTSLIATGSWTCFSLTEACCVYSNAQGYTVPLILPHLRKVASLSLHERDPSKQNKTPCPCNDTDINHIHTYACVKSCKLLKPTHWPLQCLSTLTLSQTHTHFLCGSCLSCGPQEQMDRDAVLSLSLRSSVSPWGAEHRGKASWKRERVTNRYERERDG